MIWLGDLNYRIHLPDATTRSLVERRKWNVLLENDQVKHLPCSDQRFFSSMLFFKLRSREISQCKKLKAELMDGRVFQGWQEGVIEFPPTYKYYPNSEVYYGCNDENRKSKRFRAPAW